MHAWRRPPGSFGFGGPRTSTIKALLVANLTIFLITWIGPETKGFLYHFFGLVPALAIPKLHIWQFLTYMFLHDGFWHIALNMFALWIFGSEIEATWGRRVFLQYYFFCGLGGGLTYALTSWGSQAPLVGASGAVFGILLAYGLMFPNRIILLYFILPIKAKYFVLIWGILELLAAQQQRMDGIGHYAHLGGMLFGYLFILFGTRQRGGRPGLGGLTSFWRRQRAKAQFRVVKDDTKPGPKGRDRERVDEILEKISREGLQSLTEEEQEILRRASRKH